MAGEAEMERKSFDHGPMWPKRMLNSRRCERGLIFVCIPAFRLLPSSVSAGFAISYWRYSYRRTRTLLIMYFISIRVSGGSCGLASFALPPVARPVARRDS